MLSCGCPPPTPLARGGSWPRRVAAAPQFPLPPPQVCGVALIAIGIYAQVALSEALAVSSASASSTPVAILVLGIIIFFISFFGCCGAWKESYCMVTTFAVLLSIIFLVEIAAAITGYVFKDKVGDSWGGGTGARTRLGAAGPPPPSPSDPPRPPQVRSVLEDGLWDAMHKYGEDEPATAAVDELQRDFACCGVNNYTDWATIERFRFNNTVPRSCCRVNTTSCNVRPSPATVYEKGCLQSIEAWMKKNILIVAAVALGIAFFEILGIIFACCLMKGIRSGYEVM
ncbi:hypothetical protein QYF61_006326 [Mycteria americana]|uniref:Tetraspanin n=1 Tax=Mycteria americana TaxID=33587 RepID=A0AAN7N350_MYCAM|nr:hypothetical protein QYF61_006326 [Mycteria americana]